MRHEARAESVHWSRSLHAASPTAVLLNQAHNTHELLTDECLLCHSPFQAATRHVGDFVQPVDQTGPWHVVVENASAWRASTCEVCHNPASTASNMLAFWDGQAQSYVTVKDATELCQKCHQPGTDDSRDLAGSVHEGKQCTDCHMAPGSGMNIDPYDSCTRCHPGVDPRGHPDVRTLDTTYKRRDSQNNIHFLTCTTCHA